MSAAIKYTPIDSARRVHRRLVDFAQRLDAGIARPGECTVFLYYEGEHAKHGLRCFSRMARQAVRPKYLQAGRHGVVRCLDALDRLEPLALALEGSRLPDPREAQASEARWLLMEGGKRLAAHATRAICCDVDLFACGACGYAFLMRWLFQQPDLRYRVHAETWPRLRLLIACWAQYAKHGFTPQTAVFGRDEFPLTAVLRSDVVDDEN